MTVLVDVVVVDVRQSSPAVARKLADDLAARGLGPAERLSRSLLQGDVVAGRRLEQQAGRALAQALEALGARVVLRPAVRSPLPQIRGEGSVLEVVPGLTTANGPPLPPPPRDALSAPTAGATVNLSHAAECAATSASADEGLALTALDGSEPSGVRPLPPSVAHHEPRAHASAASAQLPPDLDDAPTPAPRPQASRKHPSLHEEVLELDLPPRSPTTSAASAAPQAPAAAPDRPRTQRHRWLGRDPVSAVLFGGALGLFLAMLVAYELVRREARAQLPGLEDELATALANPHHVSAGKSRQPGTIEADLQRAWSELRSRYWLTLAGLGLPLGILLGWVKREEPTR